MTIYPFCRQRCMITFFGTWLNNLSQLSLFMKQQQWSSVLNKCSIELLKIKNPAVTMHSLPPHCTLFFTVPLIYTIYTLLYLTRFVHFLLVFHSYNVLFFCMPFHTLLILYYHHVHLNDYFMFMLQTHYHVVFFDEKDVTRGWLTPGAMIPFTGYESSKEFRRVSSSHPTKMSLPDMRMSAIHIHLRIWTPMQFWFILGYVNAVSLYSSSWDNSVSIATMLLVVALRDRLSILKGVRDISVLWNIQTISGTHPVHIFCPTCEVTRTWY